MSIISKIIKKIKITTEIKRHEMLYQGRLKYLFYRGKGDELLIVFSGFTGIKPKYNYFTSFADIEVSKLFLLDDFGYMGSYYWYENGLDLPEQLVSGLIEKILDQTGCLNIITAGSSKGGTAAIYFGLKYNAERIFTGACQYKVGTYLNRPKHLQILDEMRGEQYKRAEFVEILDRKLHDQIYNSKSDFTGIIELIYSKNELTYERQVIPLMEFLNTCGYDLVEKVENFENHDKIGTYFPRYVKKWFADKDS